MKRYKLLKDLPDIKAGTIFVLATNGNHYVTERNFPEGKYDDPAYFCGIVEAKDNDWFSPVFSHPSKEEIIEDVNKNYRDKTPYCKLFNEHEVKTCMDKHESSIKEQLIEKIEDSYFVKVSTCDTINDKETIAFKNQIIEIIRNFKSE